MEAAVITHSSVESIVENMLNSINGWKAVEETIKSIYGILQQKEFSRKKERKRITIMNNS